MIDLQTAACGRPSGATYAAVHAHLEREAELGGYAAQGAAEGAVAGLRRDLAALLGVEAKGIALTTGATEGLRLLLRVWPLPATGRVGVVATEWGPAVTMLRERGLEPVLLPTDAAGRVDVAALEAHLGGLDLVHLTQVVSHRGLEQPVGPVQEACRRNGVPLWVDAAQSLGHRPVPPGLDAAYAPGRKWLRGPRGTGVVSVGADWVARLPAPLTGLEPGEHDVAGRVGLAAAVAELSATGPEHRVARLAGAGAALRAAVSEVEGWIGADDPGYDGAIVALRPAAGQDPAVVRDRLTAEHGVRTSACERWRAPDDIDVPLLRLAPDDDLADTDVARAVAALREVSGV